MDASDLTPDELYGRPVVTGNGFDRLPAIFLGKTLEVEDFPFDDPSNSVGPEPLLDFAIETSGDEGNGVLDTKGDFRGSLPLGMLPDDESNDEEKNGKESEGKRHRDQV